ncbi:PREDICTED: transcription initiation factor TFIID subunit 7-like [Papilio xuthus]|uniref:Transcription initiation factor TFIID subunit 7 n=1 Tax=Papilio xuthus TaxID=66420 RepID=A0A194Q4Y8_PAPXU|nr:PREDICTED: transcription initiation factor TFIID subunit 7-like [Papilio xuthus]KPJ00603.1 Transcription initiation factor TFIID subunit 7 [Papilio xuthus]
MSKEKRDPEYPSELESQFVLRLPEEPAKLLRDVLKTGENLKNRLTIQIDNDMRHGEVRFDHWLMHAKIMDLPTIVESLKTIDNKSFYKTADICQMMICKDEPDTPTVEEESPSKNKKKDPYKVDKKFLWPHGITPPTKNVRKRRFRKTLKKKYVEAPEIEKEIKRLLRADNEAVSVNWEVIKDEDEHPKPEASTSAHTKPERKTKSERHKKETVTSETVNQRSSNVDDIFGGAVSDSDDENANVDMDDRLSPYDSRLSDNNSMYGIGDTHSRREYEIEFESQMFAGPSSKKSAGRNSTITSASQISKSGTLSSEEELEYNSRDMSKDNMQFRIDQLAAELEELKQRRQRTQHEIAGMENLTLRQRFQDILHTLNQDIMYKEMERQGLITLQTSDDI